MHHLRLRRKLRTPEPLRKGEYGHHGCTLGSTSVILGNTRRGIIAIEAIPRDILALFLALGQHSRRRTVHETVGVDHIASRPQSSPDVKPGTMALEWGTIAL